MAKSESRHLAKSASIHFKLPIRMKAECQKALQQYDMTVTEYCQLCLMYLYEHRDEPDTISALLKQLDDATIFSAAEDEADIALVKERLAHPQKPVAVSIDEL